MESRSRQAMLAVPAERTRFDALRRRIFDEMGRSAARWKLTRTLPFYVCVLVVLIVRGETGPRVVVQTGTVAVLACLFVSGVRWAGYRFKIATFVVSIVSYFILLATTGCLGSPLLVTGAGMIAVAAISLRDPPWLRSAIFVTFLAGFLALAALSRTALGELYGPLAPRSGWPSPEYVGMTMAAAMFTMLTVYRVGCGMTGGYERAALELAERREELCTENEDRTRALEGMAARLAHEVKNPLAAIKALSTHMARNATDGKTAERLAIVAAEADRLQSIVDGFLSFSRGLEDLKPAPTDLHEVARELAVLLETRAEDAGVGIDLVGEKNVIVNADARKIRQALLNIVLNAIQASPRGSRVTVAVARDCRGAHLTVRDEGVGMTEDVIARIRKPYFTTKEGGTGLGVAVARGLVAQHGGRLEFKSAPGKGTTVTLRLLAEATPCSALPKPFHVSGREVVEGGLSDVPAGDRALTS